MEALLAVGVLIAAAYVSFSAYQKLSRLKKQFKSAYSLVEAQLKRRYELIPNLVETAKEYLNHERETLEDIIRFKELARAASQRAAGDPSVPESIMELNLAEADLKGSLRHLLAVVEYYPNLKASATMARLTNELNSTESKISSAHQSFNHVVQDYNILRDKFPNLFISRPLGFRQAEPLQINRSEERKAAPAA
jgi:LemA protein